MKKSFVVVLALVFVLGIAGTAFAAANPFVDVPAKHWAYEAVSKLAAAGIVDGYGDGTFRGDKTMTRYEMAQIVAKALAKSDKADAQMKATIDKLAVEFAAELNNLGVRVTKLEKNQSNIKFSGAFAQRYNVTDYSGNPAKADDVYAQYRLRLDGVAKVDDKTSFGMRFTTNSPDKSDFSNTTWVKYGSNDGAPDNTVIDRIFLTTKIGDVSTTVGRQAYKMDAFDIIMDSGAFSFDGVKAATKIGNFNVNAQYGRFANQVKYSPVSFLTAATAPAVGYVTKDSALFSDFANIDIFTAAISSKTGKLNYGLGYYTWENTKLSKDLAAYYMADVSYLFDKKISLSAEYSKNDEKFAGIAGDDTLWAVKAVYGDQALTKKGHNNFTAIYLDAGANSMFNRFSGLPATTGNSSVKVNDTNNGFTYSNDQVDWKSWIVQYNYAFSANFATTFEYQDISAKNTADKVKEKDQFRFIATVKF